MYFVQILLVKAKNKSLQTQNVGTGEMSRNPKAKREHDTIPKVKSDKETRP